MAIPPGKTAHWGAVGHLPAGRPLLSCKPPSSEMNARTHPGPGSGSPAISGARRNTPGSRHMAARVHVPLSRQRQPGAEGLGEPVLEPGSDAGRAAAGAGYVFSRLDPEPGGEVTHAKLLRRERGPCVGANPRDPLVDVVMDEIEPGAERPFQIRLAR